MPVAIACPRAPARSRAATRTLSARRARPCRGCDDALRVDDHDAPAGVVLVAPRRATSCGGGVRSAALERVLGEGRHHERVALDPARQVAPLAAPVLDAERDLERGEHDDRQRDVGGEQPAAHPARAGGARRRARSRSSGVAELLPQRGDVDVDRLRAPVPGRLPHLLQDRRRETTAPGSRASSARRSNSFGVRSSSRPSTRDAPAAHVELERPDARARASRPLAASGASRRGCARAARGSRTA